MAIEGIGRGYIPPAEGAFKPKEEQKQGRDERKRKERESNAEFNLSQEDYKVKAARLEQEAIKKRQKRGTELKDAAKVIGGIEASTLEARLNKELPQRSKKESAVNIEDPISVEYEVDDPIQAAQDLADELITNAKFPEARDWKIKLATGDKEMVRIRLSYVFKYGMGKNAAAYEYLNQPENKDRVERILENLKKEKQ